VALIADDHVKKQTTEVFFHDLQVIAAGEAIGLAGLAGDIANIEFVGPAAADGRRQIGHQQVGQNTGEQAAGANNDQIGGEDGLNGGGIGQRIVGFQPDALNAARSFGDLALALDLDFLLKQGDISHQLDIMQGGRQHPPTDGQHPARLRHAFFKAAGNFGQGGDEQIAQVMPPHPGTAGKAVLEDLGEQFFIIREGGEAGANVARRQDAQTAAQLAG